MTAWTPCDGDSPSRRTVLAAGGTAILTATAGCTAAVDFLGNQLLGQVNVFNETDRQLGGSIVVVGPSDETVLDTTFDLAHADSEDNDSTAVYDDVWGDAGAYEATIELDDAEIEGESEASETVTIDDPEEQMLAVALGSTEVDESIGFRVGTSLSEFAAGNSTSS
ncbi:hypothetical protein B4589_012375 [Halolamina sp. CBA1230]|uniref:hypothetical protein n=1 Tax=Halolamina sp. CBA1230 TaxID=1853690 RepID=UPI0009A148B1|nr:hypothetical protein [Halolamina sp. CBA1230]QKY21130.1 hypothetical protein B4589_012375 [Halolamina sp. CBA1230]